MSQTDDLRRPGSGEHAESRAADFQEKIVVDEEWKNRVQREKEEAARAKSEDDAAEDDPVLPPPTLTALAGSLSMQALAALGLLPDPLTGKTEVRLNRARHLIDTVNLLYEKTGANLTEEEKRALEEMLHELRLAYVQVQSRHNPGTKP